VVDEEDVSGGRPGRRGDWFPEVAGALVGGGYQLLGGDALSGSLIAVGSTLAIRLDIRNIEERARRTERVVDEAAQAVGGHDQLEVLASASDVHLEFSARVLEAAARTTIDEKLRALSEVLVAGLTPDTVVDEAAILADALHEIDRPHIGLLRVLAEAQVTTDAITEVGGGWTRDRILEALPGMRLTLDAILGALERHDLVRSNEQTWPGGIGYERPGPYAVTPLGLRLLELLRPDDKEIDQVGGGTSE
jgi:hypothetical protein